MKHYIDIKLHPDSEFSSSILLNAIYIKLHKILYDLNTQDIGVSFPNYKKTLGDILRLHGNKQNLELLQKKNWLGGMHVYCHMSDILDIPANCKHRNVSRIQATMSQSKLKRLIKRGSMSEEQIEQYRSKMSMQALENPYLELESHSNGHKHRRYIHFGEISQSLVEGKFDSFGLSKTATIPWF